MCRLITQEEYQQIGNNLQINDCLYAALEKRFYGISSYLLVPNRIGRSVISLFQRLLYAYDDKSCRRNNKLA